jgi:Domain of unknown function (DUF6431)
MQSLHPFQGSIQEYLREISDPNRYRPDGCPQCHAKRPLRAHGFYWRTLVEVNFDRSIPVRRYLCCLCQRTVSLLPQFALPYLRFGITVLSLFLVARLLQGRSLREAARAALQPSMPYQRGQFWIRRFQKQAAALCTALAALTAVMPAVDFPTRALRMLEGIGWIAAHRFLFAKLHIHLLGWPRSLIPHGDRLSFSLARSSS